MCPENTFVVYITTYLGNKLPPKLKSNIKPTSYIGSSSIKKINNGYRGSVKSKKYKSIWNSELKLNPQLFSIDIISYHPTRLEATKKELHLQQIFNVVSNPLFINMSYAQPCGYFGMDISNENNPNFNNTWSKQQKQEASERSKNQHKTIGKTKFLSNDELKQSLQIPISEIQKYILEGWYFGRKYMNTTNTSAKQKELAPIRNATRCSCLICKEEIQSINLSKHIKSHYFGIEYFGKIYVSFSSLKQQTGCTAELYKKYYLNNIDPRPRIGTNGPPEKNYNLLFKL